MGVGAVGDGDAEPVARALVVGIAEVWVGLAEFDDAVGLAFDADNLEDVDVEEAEHVALDIEDQHALSAFEGCEGEALFHVGAQREAVVAKFFNIHGERRLMWVFE